MSDWQAGQQVLWLHPYGLVGSHRQYEIDRLTPDLGDHDAGIGKVELEQPDHAPHGHLIDVLAIPEHVANFGRVRIKTHVPGKIDVLQLRQRLDRYVDTEHMSDP